MPDVVAIGAFLEPAHRDLAEKVRAFARVEIRELPEAADDDRARLQARELMAVLGNAGWFQPIAEADLRACGIIRETLAAASPLADAVFALQALGSLPILHAGSKEQKEEWIPGVTAGKIMAAFAMTEPDAGSDVGSLTTRAVRDGDDYVLSGRKTFISNAGLADFYTTFATTDPEKGRKGITAFLVPADAEGLEFVRPLVMASPHPLGEIAFEKCRVPASFRLGKEGEGLKIGLATLDRLRATVGAAACGMAERALEEAVAHAREREQFGKPIGEFQLVQQKIARMATDLKASRLLVYQALAVKDGGAERVTVEAAMAKAFATEAAQRIVDDAVQILGGKGVLAGSVVDRLYRSVRALRIYEGTTEIQHLIIAGQILKDPGKGRA